MPTIGKKPYTDRFFNIFKNYLECMLCNNVSFKINITNSSFIEIANFLVFSSIDNLYGVKPYQD